MHKILLPFLKSSGENLHQYLYPNHAPWLVWQPVKESGQYNDILSKIKAIKQLFKLKAEK
jgi:hypothetical protein